MRPNHHAYAGNRKHGTDHGLVSKQGLPGESRYNVRQHPNRRKQEDIDLRMSKEPEQMLKQYGVATAGGYKKAGAEMTIEQQHRDTTR